MRLSGQLDAHEMTNDREIRFCQLGLAAEVLRTELGGCCSGKKHGESNRAKEK